MRRLALPILFLLMPSAAYAATCVLPYTLLNGTIADANQVMANFNAIKNCLGGISIGMVGDNVLYTPGIVGSPITSSGAFDLSRSLKNIGPNLVLAGPSSGAAGPPTFRPLASADLPPPGPPGPQSANTVYAGPVSGVPATPGFRALVSADVPGLPVSVLDYGASISAADNSAAFAAAFAANCGKAVSVPQGTWRFTSPIPSQSCGVQIVGAGKKATTLDFTGVPSPLTSQPMMSFSGTEGPPVSLAADATFGSFNVSVSSAAGFCASGSDSAAPGCFVHLGSNAMWDPGTLNHKRGELRPICFISGSTLTLCEPLDESYLVSDAAIAFPVAMISGMEMSGVTLKGPKTDNGFQGIAIDNAYFPFLHDNDYYYFAGEGGESFQNLWHPKGAFQDFYGIGSAATTYDAYAAIDSDATEYSQHDHENCYETGPCWTSGFGLAAYGAPRYAWVTNSIAHNLSGLNGYAYQSHSAGAYYWFDNIQVSYSPSNGGHGACFTFGVPNVFINNFLCQHSEQGINISNYTNSGGAPSVTNGRIEDVTSIDCIAFVQTPTGAPGVAFAAINVRNIRLDGCKHGGIRLYNSNTISETHNIHINGADITNVGLVGAGYQWVYLQNAYDVHLSDITGDTLHTATDTGYLLQNIQGGSVSSVIGNMPSGSTGIGIRMLCDSSNSGNSMVFESDTITGPSPSNLRGIYFDSNCLGNTIGANNLLSGTTLPFVLGTGSGNRSTYPLYGTAGTLGGSPLGPGACTGGGIASVPGVSGAAVVTAGTKPNPDPGDSFLVKVYGDLSDNEIVVKVCNFSAGTLTPTSGTYPVVVSGQVIP